MKKVNIKTEDFRKWIAEQPDTKKLNFKEYCPEDHDDNFCGCPMIQYGREVLNLSEDTACGCNSWAGSEYKLEEGVWSVIGFSPYSINDTHPRDGHQEMTYGELKKTMKRWGTLPDN